MKISFTVLLIFLITPLFSQKIEDLKISIWNNELIVDFKVNTGLKNSRVELEYTLLKNDESIKIEPLTQDKQVLESLGFSVHSTFDISKVESEKIKLLIDVNISHPFVDVYLHPEKNFRRGGERQINWETEDKNVTLGISLYRNDQMIHFVDHVTRDNFFNWRIPKSIEPGDEYRLRLYDINNPEKHVYSETFAIKRRLGVILPFCVGIPVGAALYVLYNQSDENALNKVGTPPTPPDN